MSNARTDAHSPTNLVTEDYSFVAGFDTEEGIANKPEVYVAWRNGIYSKVFQTNAARGMNQCHHCGARMRYVAVLEHLPTGEYIAVGETCADGRFSVATEAFQAMRKAAELDRKAMRIKTAVTAFVTENPDMAWMAEKVTPEPFASNSFLSDVARKLRAYGEISAAQYNAVVRVAADVVTRAAQPVEVEETAPVIEGRIVITGTVLTTKWQDSDFGGSLKMLVKDARNFKVWGTVPSSLNVDKGDVITFTATVETSANDESFGYFKRPSKASVITEAAA